MSQTALVLDQLDHVVASGAEGSVPLAVMVMAAAEEERMAVPSAQRS